jgi:hypothetical protein
VSDPTTGLLRPLVVGVVALVLASLFVLSQFSKFDWDPTHFVAFGEEATEIRAYAEDRLGVVRLRQHLGHDGRFFFVQANDPWILNPEENAYLLDRPLYRSQRMLYPTVAGGFGLLGPEGIVWAMLLVNLAAMGLGSWAVAWIAATMGGSAWWGLAFILNLGFISELDVGGAGIVAGAAAFGALALLLNGRTWAGVALLTLAALSREVMLVVAAGTAFHLWRRGEKPHAIGALAVPFVAVVGWALYLQFRMSLDSGLSDVREIGVPFVGFIQAFDSWIEDPVDLVVGLSVFLVLGLFVRRSILQDNIVGWAFFGFVPLALLLTEQVWHSYFDITRGVAPLLSAFVLLAAVGEKPQLRNGPILRATEQA